MAMERGRSLPAAWGAGKFWQPQACPLSSVGSPGSLGGRNGRGFPAGLTKRRATPHAGRAAGIPSSSHRSPLLQRCSHLSASSAKSEPRYRRLLQNDSQLPEAVRGGFRDEVSRHVDEEQILQRRPRDAL